MNTIEKRSLYVCDRIMQAVDGMTDQARSENWDGRELFIGVGLAFRQFCALLRIDPDKAVEILKSLRVPKEEAPDSVGKIIAPGGRPLGNTDDYNS